MKPHPSRDSGSLSKRTERDRLPSLPGPCCPSTLRKPQKCPGPCFCCHCGTGTPGVSFLQIPGHPGDFKPGGVTSPNRACGRRPLHRRALLQNLVYKLCLQLEARAWGFHITHERPWAGRGGGTSSKFCKFALKSFYQEGPQSHKERPGLFKHSKLLYLKIRRSGRFRGFIS